MGTPRVLQTAFAFAVLFLLLKTVTSDFCRPNATRVHLYFTGENGVQSGQPLFFICTAPSNHNVIEIWDMEENKRIDYCNSPIMNCTFVTPNQSTGAKIINKTVNEDMIRKSYQCRSYQAPLDSEGKYCSTPKNLSDALHHHPTSKMSRSPTSTPSAYLTSSSDVSVHKITSTPQPSPSVVHTRIMMCPTDSGLGLHRLQLTMTLILLTIIWIIL